MELLSQCFSQLLLAEIEENFTFAALKAFTMESGKEKNGALSSQSTQHLVSVTSVCREAQAAAASSPCSPV